MVNDINSRRLMRLADKRHTRVAGRWLPISAIAACTRKRAAVCVYNTSNLTAFCFVATDRPAVSREQAEPRNLHRVHGRPLGAQYKVSSYGFKKLTK